MLDFVCWLLQKNKKKKMDLVFNEAHRSLCGRATELKERVQEAFQAVFGGAEGCPRLERLLASLGNVIYDLEDLEFTVDSYVRKCRDIEVYVVILDLEQFVNAVTEVVDLLDEGNVGAAVEGQEGLLGASSARLTAASAARLTGASAARLTGASSARLTGASAARWTAASSARLTALCAELISACDEVRSAARNLKFIRTPIKPEAHELCYNDQD